MKLRYVPCFLVVSALLNFTSAVRADTIAYGPFSVPLQTTNWSQTISVPKFDPSLGTLDAIDFTLIGHVEGTAAFESLDAAPATVTVNLAAQIQLQRPDSTIILVALPLVSASETVPAFDGVLDFGGDSGRQYSDLSATVTESTTSPPPVSDLTLFTGLGFINLPVVATGASSGSGAGNLLLAFNTYGSAEVSVVYHYTVPEPGSLGLLAVAGVSVLRRRVF